MIDVLITCPICGATYSVEVPFEGYMAWLGGELIQNALGDVPAEVRESLLSGLCLDCQAKMFI